MNGLKLSILTGVLMIAFVETSASAEPYPKMQGNWQLNGCDYNQNILQDPLTRTLNIRFDVTDANVVNGAVDEDRLDYYSLTLGVDLYRSALPVLDVHYDTKDILVPTLDGKRFTDSATEMRGCSICQHKKAVTTAVAHDNTIDIKVVKSMTNMIGFGMKEYLRSELSLALESMDNLKVQYVETRQKRYKERTKTCYFKRAQ